MKYILFAALLALANAQVYIGSSPPESFKNMSPPDGNEWTNGSKVGAILGFGVFGAAYLATVISIVLDIRKSGANYDMMISEDLQQIKMLGLSNRMAEMDAELLVRLSGKKVESSGDDQLLGEAAKLNHDAYKKYL